MKMKSSQNLKGIIKKSNLYLENGKMIKIYTNNKIFFQKYRKNHDYFWSFNNI